MRLPFELDPQIIHHIIYSQAGSIGKAIIELVMNSVDAGATSVALEISSEGFSCKDDGQGFASRDDVLRYFGRFGTPHQDGDATYGRFRLGRGQIMAHARTVWRSRSWQMTVDTREMGYNYELEEPGVDENGCAISGEWYELLSNEERMSCIQEIRDLIRYTPVIVHLNGSVISRLPAQEKWDAEDDEAWYRLRDDGAVSIHNQGVLVRHDPGSLWGVGGLIVSKKPLALNVSRTEILRKTCPLWKKIAAKFGAMAKAFSDAQGDNRKTEARREKTARMLLAGEGDMSSLLHAEEVITLLPGKRHIPLLHFLRICNYRGVSGERDTFTVAPSGRDVPRGELLARMNIAIVLHPITMARFGCYNEYEFIDALERIRANYNAWCAEQSHVSHWMGWNVGLKLIDFYTLSDAFVDHTQVASEKSLDAETRRAWIALRWCLAQYAAMCAGGRSSSTGRVRGGISFSILLGVSTSADAWTDGKTYIAFNADIVRRLKSDALRTASLLFSLTEHEVAHEGDSLDCGHDEAFYQRFHDISTTMAPQRQYYFHIWLRKYTTSLEGAGKRAAGSVWREQWLEERASSGRQKNGLPGLTDTESIASAVSALVAPEDKSLLSSLNLSLQNASADALVAPDWPSVVAEGLRAATEGKELYLEQERQLEAWYQSEDDIDQRAVSEQQEDAEGEEMERMWLASNKARYLSILPGATADTLTDYIVAFLAYNMDSEDEERAAWASRAWEDREADDEPEQDFEQPIERDIPVDWRPFVRDGETRWMIERNAAAAGFLCEMDYLEWRKENEG